MTPDRESILARVREFNEGQFRKHGATPRGVGWNGDDAQLIRFDQLWRAMEPVAAEVATLNDVGCGYGELVSYLRGRGSGVGYRGYDISEPALDHARRAHEGEADVSFAPLEELSEADFSVASGLFALRFDLGDEEWLAYVVETLDAIAAASVRGFAFNMLTVHSDAERMQDELYYADPAAILDLCLRRYSRKVAIFHDYELFDFTVSVRLGA